MLIIIKYKIIICFFTLIKNVYNMSHQVPNKYYSVTQTLYYI